MKSTTVRWIIIGLIVIAGIYLLTDHGQHVMPYLPLAFLFGCLFMHLFGHGGHGEHNHEEHGQSKQ